MLTIAKSFYDDIAALDRRVLLTLVYTAVALAATFYLKESAVGAKIFAALGFNALADEIYYSTDNNFAAMVWWAFALNVFYIIGPVVLIKLVWREKLSDYGLSLSLEKGFWKLLLFCTAVMLPLVYLMSLTKGFAAKYPFYKVYNDAPYISTTFFVWELVYFFQFFGLEFFFRGFMVHSLKARFGMHAILVMMVPYCMIHFGKPPAETIAAIFAGIFLGWISYRNGSIWLGLALHCIVAFSMDIFALLAKGLLF